MVDLEKLDNAINELDSSSKIINQIAKVVNDTKNIELECKNNIKIISEIIDKTQLINKEIEKSTTNIEHSVKILDNYCTQSNEKNAIFISKVNTQLLEMKNENNGLYKEFESIILSKFDRFKSDIEVQNNRITDDIYSRLNNKINVSSEDTKNSINKNKDEIIIILNKKINLLTILSISSIIISTLLLAFLIVNQ